MNKYILSFCCLAVSLHMQAQQTLKEAYKDCFLMGVAVNQWQSGGERPQEMAVINEQFNSVVAENCMKSCVIHPQENQYDFKLADEFVAMGEKNHHFIIGHCLIWHSQLAPWFCVDKAGKNVSPEVLKQRMKDHIYTIMHRYKGHIRGWDVVNEAVEDDGSFRNSAFYQILGEDYIKYAFQYAHEADPDAELYYNDYSMANPKRRATVVRLVNQLRGQGLRVDAIGMQGHLTLDSNTAEEYAQSIEAFAATGAKVMVTELDLSALPNPYSHTGANIADRFKYTPESDPYKAGMTAEGLATWEKRYLDFFRVLVQHKQDVSRVTLWGLTDKDSWRNDFPIHGRTDYALLFDRQAKAKPIVQKLIDLTK